MASLRPLPLPPPQSTGEDVCGDKSLARHGADRDHRLQQQGHEQAPAARWAAVCSEGGVGERVIAFSNKMLLKEIHTFLAGERDAMNTWTTMVSEAMTQRVRAGGGELPLLAGGGGNGASGGTVALDAVDLNRLASLLAAAGPSPFAVLGELKAITVRHKEEEEEDERSRCHGLARQDHNVLTLENTSANPNANTNANSNSNTSAKPNTNSNSSANTNTNANASANTNSNTNTNAHTTVGAVAAVTANRRRAATAERNRCLHEVLRTCKARKKRLEEEVLAIREEVRRLRALAKANDESKEAKRQANARNKKKVYIYMTKHS